MKIVENCWRDRCPSVRRRNGLNTKGEGLSQKGAKQQVVVHGGKQEGG